MTRASKMAALLVLACAPAWAADAGTTPERAAGIRFIEDDFAGALAKAKAEGRPLFVDAWAPW